MATLKKYLPNYVLLTPFLIIYLIFTMYPLSTGFLVSFYDWRILGENTYVALQNYITIFNDPVFYRALLNTFIFVLFSSPVMVVGGFLFALIVNQPLKGASIYRIILFAPYVLPVSVVASIWVAVLGNYSGLVNTILNTFGVTDPIFWLRDPVLAWVSIIIITFWWQVGFTMILYWAGLQEVPDDLYEAGKIDGANAWQRLIYITLPYLKRIHVLVIFLQLIGSFKVFGQVYLVTGGGPAGSTRTLIQYIYEEGFQRYIMGTASAMSYFLFVLLIFVSIFQLRLMKND